MDLRIQLGNSWLIWARSARNRFYRLQRSAETAGGFGRSSTTAHPVEERGPSPDAVHE